MAAPGLTHRLHFLSARQRLPVFIYHVASCRGYRRKRSYFYLLYLPGACGSERWHSQVAAPLRVPVSIPTAQVARSPEHCRPFAAPHSILGSELVPRMFLEGGSSPETLCRVGTCRVGSVMAQRGHSSVEGS